MLSGGRRRAAAPLKRNACSILVFYRVTSINIGRNTEKHMALKEWFNQLRSKGFLYWLTVLVLVGGGTMVGHHLEEKGAWVELRYRIYQLMEKLSHRQSYARNTVVILIGDEEYWKGELARRVPIKRSYLAKLLRALDAADPAVIAIDFDLRSPMPDGTIVEHPDYQNETKEFLEVVKAVARNRPVVLPKTVSLDDEQDYVIESDIYDGFDFGGSMVLEGYISLPFDLRKIPLSLTMKDGATIDSFVEAIVSAFDQKALNHVPKTDEAPYGSYLRADDFPQFPANHVLKTEPKLLKADLNRKIVIIGGAWHSRAYERFAQIDTYFTPVGWIGGVFIHSNYVEALLDLRTLKPSGERILLASEIILAIVVAMIFALHIRRLLKLAIITSLCLGLIAITYVSWQNLGLFFDFFIPLVLVANHAFAAQVWEWRTDARKYAQLDSSERKELP